MCKNCELLRLCNKNVTIFHSLFRISKEVLHQYLNWECLQPSLCAWYLLRSKTEFKKPIRQLFWNLKIEEYDLMNCFFTAKTFDWPSPWYINLIRILSVFFFSECKIMRIIYKLSWAKHFFYYVKFIIFIVNLNI